MKYQEALDYIREVTKNTDGSLLIRHHIDNLQQAVNITNEIKNYILHLEKAQKKYKEYYLKEINNKEDEFAEFWNGMENSVLACINDLKRIVGEENG